MKNLKTTIAMGLALSLSSLSALAGGVGNGGVSVVCRNQTGQITSAEVLDIYEGQVRYGRKYDGAIDADTKIELVQLKLTKFPSFLTKFQEELARVRAIMVFVPKGNRLVPTNDAFPKIEKLGCDFEQLANYTDEAELLISQEIHDELDELNKAALLVHETVYAIFRKYGAKDSQLSRKLTAQLLAKNADQNVINAILEGNFGTTTSGDGTCGNSGTVEQRIKNCNQTNGNFALVARTRHEKEVWKDLKSGLLWSDRLPLMMSQYDAKYACKPYLNEMAGISNSVAWRLPSIEEYVQAEKNGIRKSLLNMKYWFWTSSMYDDSSVNAYVFNGNDGGTYYGHQSMDDISVRCVAH